MLIFEKHTFKITIYSTVDVHMHLYNIFGVYLRIRVLEASLEQAEIISERSIVNMVEINNNKQKQNGALLGSYHLTRQKQNKLN